MASLCKLFYLVALILPILSHNGFSSQILEKTNENSQNKKLQIIKGLLSGEIDPGTREKLNKDMDSLLRTDDEKFNDKVSILKILCEKKRWQDAFNQLNMIDCGIEKPRQAILEEYKTKKEIKIERCKGSLSGTLPISEREKIMEELIRLDPSHGDTLLNTEELTIQNGIINELINKKLHKEAAEQLSLSLHYNLAHAIRDSQPKDDRNEQFINLVKDMLGQGSQLVEEWQQLLEQFQTASREDSKVRSLIKLINCSLKILRKFKKMEGHDLIYDGTVMFCYCVLDQCGLGADVQFIQKCWDENKNSATIKMLYAFLCLNNKVLSLENKIKKPELIVKEIRNEYIKIQTDIIKIDRFKTANNFSHLGVALTKEKNCSEAIKVYAQALEKYPSDWNISMSYAMCLAINNNYKDASQELNRILKMENVNVDRDCTERFLIVFYQRADMDSEASKLIEKRTEKALKRIAEKKHSIEESGRKLEGEKIKPKNVSLTKDPTQEKIDRDKLKKALLNSEKFRRDEKEAISSDSLSGNLKKEYLTQNLTAKPKTHKLGDLTKKTKKKVNVPSKKEPESAPILKETQTLEDLLNKNNYETVLEIFRVFMREKNAAAAKISMDSIDRLFSSLGGDFDASKGKGSHTKLTIDNATKDQMIILSKETFLLDPQAKQIAQALLSLNLYPKEMEENLKKKKSLKMEEDS